MSDFRFAPFPHAHMGGCEPACQPGNVYAPTAFQIHCWNQMRRLADAEGIEVGWADTECANAMQDDSTVGA